MADDDQKTQDVEEKTEEVAQKAQEAVDEAKEAVEKAKQATDKAEEAVEEVKEVVKEPTQTQATEEKQPAKATKAVSVKLEKLISEIEKLSVLELADLVKALETRFRVSAAPSVAVTPTGQAAPIGDSAETASEQTTFNVILANSGANKISVIKAVRELVPTLGLKEAKDLVDAAPKELMSGVNKENANEAKQKLEAAGATVELK